MKTTVLILSICMLIVGCGGGGGGTPPPPPPPTPSVSLSANPTTLTLGQATTLTWSGSNITSCTAGGEWSGAKATSGSESVTPTSTGAKTYTLTCSGSNGNASASANVTVNAPAGPTLEWLRQVDFFESSSGFRAITLADDGIVVGGFKNKDGTHVAVAAKFDGDGNEKWRLDYGAQPSSFITAARHPSEDKYFFAGHQFDSSLVTTVNTTGQILSEKNCQLGVGGIVSAKVLGETLYLATGRRIFTADLTGNPNCESGFDVRDHGQIWDLWVAPDRILVVGVFDDNSGTTNKAAFLRTFDLAGNLLGNELVFDDLNDPHVIEVVENGTAFVYVGGNQVGMSDLKFLTVKLQNGNEVWRREWNGDNNSNFLGNQAYDIIPLPGGGVVQIGALTELGQSDLNRMDVGAIAYTPSGSVLWKLRHGNQGSESAFAGSFDSAGRLYLVGIARSTNTSGNATILKFRVP